MKLRKKDIQENNLTNVKFIYVFLFKYFMISKLKILKPNVKLLFKDTMNYISPNNILPIVSDS